ncbi:MAG: 3-phosphoshikimate 1-carboxyvinyltransferase [Spirochaetes bacterium]|nr:3-phosphoshikimate 1-carboxyvinyltransferase [Spirochaetota bacterium]
MERTVFPARVQGEVLIPASKSHTIRGLLIASMAEGESLLINPLDSEDARSCIAACQHLGAYIEEETDVLSGTRTLKVRGTGGNILYPSQPIDVGNSGTTLYLACGLAALGYAPIQFTGDAQIQSRPARNLLRALEDLGARVTYQGKEGFAPFTIQGPLRGGKTRIECPTSQYLSSLLITAPLIEGETEIEVPLLYERPYVEMTLRWLEEQGIQLERNGLEWFRIPGRQRFHRFQKQIPGDFSSATFFFCAAAITRSTLTLLGLDMGDSQGDKEVVHILEQMGCSARIEIDRITLTGHPLKGIEIDLNAMPDALPALAATACYAEGTTRIVNVPQARLKETDRIAVMAQELSKLGARVKELPDGLEIHGLPLQGGRVNGHGDHRVVMSLAIAALAAEGPVTIETAEAASVTFPTFFELLERISVPESPF